MMYGQEGGYGSVPKKKNGKLIFVIVFGLIILLGVGGFLYYKFVYSANPMKVLLNKGFDYLENAFDDEEYDSIVSKVDFQMEFSSSDGDLNKLFGIINKVKFSGTTGIDYDKNIMSMDFSSDYDGKDLLDFAMYTEYGSAYLYLNGIYDKYIEVPIDNYSDLFERNNEDTKNIFLGVSHAFEKALKDEYFDVENVELDGKKVKKSTLDLTGNNGKEFFENIIKNLKNDKEFLNSCSKMLGLGVNDIKDGLNDLSEESEYFELGKFVLYTKNFDFVKFEFAFEHDKLVIERNNKKYEYKIIESDYTICSGYLELVENKKDASVVKFSIYVDDEELGMDFVIGLSTDKNGKVAKKDVSNSISYEDISEDDTESMYENLMENKGMAEIIEDVSELYEGSDDSEFSMLN